MKKCCLPFIHYYAHPQDDRDVGVNKAQGQGKR